MCKYEGVSMQPEDCVPCEWHGGVAFPPGAPRFSSHKCYGGPNAKPPREVSAHPRTRLIVVLDHDPESVAPPDWCPLRKGGE